VGPGERLSSVRDWWVSGARWQFVAAQRASEGRAVRTELVKCWHSGWPWTRLVELRRDFVRTFAEPSIAPKPCRGAYPLDRDRDLDKAGCAAHS
jgi:hypothetical protein